MAEEEELLEFVRGIEWEKHADDPDVMDIISQIKTRVGELDDGHSEDDPDSRAKVVVVGDGAVGKTCLFVTYTSGEFPKEYVPTVFDNSTHETKYKGKPFLLHLWDTAGQEDYDRLRPLSYPGTEVIILCFSLVSESTFESISSKWNPEVDHYLSSVPKILVGTKLDMREEKKKDSSTSKYEEITTEEGEQLAKDIGAVGYIETAAINMTNLTETFEMVIAAALAHKGGEEDKPKVKKVEKEVKKKKKTSKKTSTLKDDGEKKKKKKKSSRHPDETEQERKERHRLRREAKKTETGEKKKKKSSKKSDDPEKKKKKKKKKEDK